MIERITFNTSGWHEHEKERKKDWVVWGNAGDILSLAAEPSPWKTFKPMEREYWIADARQMARPGGIVSVDPRMAGHRPAIEIIYKRTEGTGYRYTGMLVVEFCGYWCQVTGVFGERGVTGVREAVLTRKLLSSGEIKIRKHSFYHRIFTRSSGYVEGWFVDPYDAKYRGTVLRSVTDSEEYDQEFPDHPLARLRSTLRTVRESLQFLD
jgi:hypothetical protein